MKSLRKSVGYAVMFSAATAAVIACSGKTEDSADAAVTNTYTVDNICDKIGQPLCEARKSCCTTGRGGFNQASCEAAQKAECLKNTAEVKNGTMKFDGTKVDSCIAKLKPFLDECRLEFSKLISYYEVLDECRIFEGSRSAGESCDRASQCASPAGTNSFPTCVAGRCAGGHIAAESEDCRIDFREGRICANGLYCKNNGGGKYACAKAIPEGGACDSSNFLELSCGHGYYCDSNKCTRGKDGSTSCRSPLECKSVACNFGTCSTPEPVVNTDACGI